MATQKFINETGLSHYTSLVKKADKDVKDWSEKKVNVTQIASGDTGTFPVLLNELVWDRQGGSGGINEAKTDTGLRFNVATKELIITDGTNTSKFSPTGGDAGDFTGTTTVGIVAGTSSASPKVEVKVGSSAKATSGEITKATTGLYGVTKLSDTAGTSTTLAATQNLASKVKQSSQTGSNALSLLMTTQTSPTSGTSYDTGYDSNLKFTPNTDTLQVGIASSSASGTTITPSSVKVGKTSGYSELTATDLTVGGVALGNHNGTNDGATKVGYSNSANGFTTVQNVDSALDTIITTLSTSDLKDEKVKQTSLTSNNAPSVSSPVNILFGNVADGTSGEAYTGEAQYYPENRAIKLMQNYNSQSMPLWLVNGGLVFGGLSTPSTTDYINKDNYTGKALQTETDLKAYYADTDTNGGSAHIGYTDVNEYLQSNNVCGAITELAGAVFDSASDVGLAARVTTLEGKTVNLTATQFNGNASTATTATNANNFKGNVTVGNTEGTSSAGPKITVQLAGMSSVASSGSINIAASNKYGVVKIDDSPTQNSSNAVTSGGVYTFVGEQIASYKNSEFKVASAAEQTAISNGTASSLESGIIYLVSATGATSPNVYDEYIKVRTGGTDDNPTYLVEKIGTTDAGVDVVSLTNNEIDSIWAAAPIADSLPVAS